MYIYPSIHHETRPLIPALCFCAWQLISDSRGGKVSGIINNVIAGSVELTLSLKQRRNTV